MEVVQMFQIKQNVKNKFYPKTNCLLLGSKTKLSAVCLLTSGR